MIATRRTFLCLALSSLETEAFSFMADRRKGESPGRNQDSGSGSGSGEGGEEMCRRKRRRRDLCVSSLAA
jgi:hypothetical protein